MEKSGNGIGEGYFTDVMLHSSINCHQEHALPMATEPHRLYKDIAAACGTLFFTFPWSSQSIGIINLWFRLRGTAKHLVQVAQLAKS